MIFFSNTTTRHIWLLIIHLMTWTLLLYSNNWQPSYDFLLYGILSLCPFSACPCLCPLGNLFRQGASCFCLGFKYTMIKKPSFYYLCPIWFPIWFPFGELEQVEDESLILLDHVVNTFNFYYQCPIRFFISVIFSFLKYFPMGIYSFFKLTLYLRRNETYFS